MRLFYRSLTSWTLSLHHPFILEQTNIQGLLQASFISLECVYICQDFERDIVTKKARAVSGNKVQASVEGRGYLDEFKLK